MSLKLSYLTRFKRVVYSLWGLLFVSVLPLIMALESDGSDYKTLNIPEYTFLFSFSLLLVYIAFLLVKYLYSGFTGHDIEIITNGDIFSSKVMQFIQLCVMTSICICFYAYILENGFLPIDDLKSWENFLIFGFQYVATIFLPALSLSALYTLIYD